MEDQRDEHPRQTRRVLVAERLYTPDEIVGPVALVLDQHRIHDIWRNTDVTGAQQRAAQRWPESPTEIVDLRPWRLAPGYIDLHIHGQMGHDISTGPEQDVAAVAGALPATGVTAFLPTIATNTREATAEQVRRITLVAQRQPQAGPARILGTRLEGPFISHAKKGAQYAPGIRPADPDEVSALDQASQHRIRIVDYAPEHDPDQRLLERLLELNIVPALGHTDATYAQAQRAIDAGARHVTHLFNAMRDLDHRLPGLVGAALTDRRVTVEVIADGLHVHPALLRIAVAARGPDAVALITDGAAAAGLPDGDYQFPTRVVRVAQGAVRLPDGTLAGSVLTVDRAVRHMVRDAGLRWSDAIRMATTTPARIIGLGANHGRLVAGATADVVALDEQGYVQGTWMGGERVYQRADTDDASRAGAASSVSTSSAT